MECQSKDIKELFYLFHYIILKEVNSKDRCLRAVVKALFEKFFSREDISNMIKELRIDILMQEDP